MDRYWRAAYVVLALLPLGAIAQDRSDTRYVVDPEQSDIHWRVYRAGAFARLGHNHVVSVAGLEGSITVPEDATASQWSLRFDVADLVVDDPELRAVYGEEFSSEPSEDDIAGTRTNMLSETVLNGEVFPSIRIRGTGLSGSLDDATLSVVVAMLGREIALDLPARIRISEGVLIAEGEFGLLHEDLGMKPFSVMMGALKVDEPLDFSYRIHAREQGR